jgi:hypothetical protein
MALRAQTMTLRRTRELFFLLRHDWLLGTAEQQTMTKQTEIVRLFGSAATTKFYEGLADDNQPQKQHKNAVDLTSKVALKKAIDQNV